MAISIQVINKEPTNLNYSIPSASDSILNTYFDVILNVKNDTGSDITVFTSALVCCDQNEYHDLSETISDGIIKPIPIHSRITNWTTKQATIHFPVVSGSVISGLTVAAYRQIK